MSRSNPTAENPHPCNLWLEWKGGPGHLTFFDKNKGENGERVAIEKPFRAIVLDRTATVRGYSKLRKSGLYANEVRDTRTDPMTVRYFDGKEIIASGLWNDIKDIVTSKRHGGGFVVNLYLAYKDGADLKVGCLQAGGCALGPWFEFEKANRKKLWEKGLVISKGEKTDNGGVEFIPPTFSLCDVTPETEMAAKKLDVELQAFLKEYFERSHTEQKPASNKAAGSDEPPMQEPTIVDAYDAQPEAPPEPDETDIPF